MEDNARKFIVSKVNSEFLGENGAIRALLIVDWLITEEDKEKKLVYKKFENGEIQFGLVEKIILDGSRTTKKTKLIESDYNSSLSNSTVHLEKIRYEFNYEVNGVLFSLKYDEFKNGELCMFEIDAKTEEERNSFPVHNLPFELEEVTGDMRYYGYRMAEMLK